MALKNGTHILIVIIAILATAPSMSQAHVKWFAPYDINQQPTSIGDAISSNFVYLYIVSIFCIYTFFLVDRLAFRRKFLEGPLNQLKISQALAFDIMRFATAVMFFALAGIGFLVSPIWLTPELHTDTLLAPVLQLAAALVVLVPRTVPVAGIIIASLYILAIADFGVFHLLDYLFFLGLAAFLGLSRLSQEIWVRTRYVTLFATTGLTLGWAAMEKLAYPDWTFPLLDQYPTITMGMDYSFFMVLAAFVEFNIAFILLSSASVFSRLIALVFNNIFITAIYIFGWIDALGHLIIITVLIILTVRGPTSARNFLVLSDKSVWAEAYFMTGLWMLAMNVLALLYWGLHYQLVG